MTYGVVKGGGMCIIKPQMVCPGGYQATIECNSIKDAWHNCIYLWEWCKRMAKVDPDFENPYDQLKPKTEQEQREEWKKLMERAKE